VQVGKHVCYLIAGQDARLVDAVSRVHGFALGIMADANSYVLLNSCLNPAGVNAKSYA
jgi:hypothetical protein